MRIYIAILLVTSVVIAIVTVDLALGGMRELPSAALFRAAHIAILVAYLAFGVMLLLPVLFIGISAVLLALLVAYLALGAAQATAIAAGLEERGNGRWRAWLVALLLAYLPFLGSAFAVRGAVLGWNWRTGKGLLRFFGPLTAILAPPLLF